MIESIAFHIYSIFAVFCIFTGSADRFLHHAAATLALYPIFAHFASEMQVKFKNKRKLASSRFQMQ